MSQRAVNILGARRQYGHTVRERDGYAYHPMCNTTAFLPGSARATPPRVWPETGCRRSRRRSECCSPPPAKQAQSKIREYNYSCDNMNVKAVRVLAERLI
jgi:hypothetical protein